MEKSNKDLICYAHPGVLATHSLQTEGRTLLMCEDCIRRYKQVMGSYAATPVEL